MVDNIPLVRFEDNTSSFVADSSNVSGMISSGNIRSAPSRRMMRWKTPSFGWVKMALNPEQIQIADKKDIVSTRTKAGFIVQYAGESLTQISIDGTTGSSGIEGINILRSIYRSEQIAFRTIADELDKASLTHDFNQAAKTFLDNGNQSDFASNLQEVGLSSSGQPFPTLASLAANVELYFQGELFRGWFEDFSVTEGAGNGVGLFNYSIRFVAHSRQGIRRNFMPWHKQPFNPIGLGENSSNPYAFDGGSYIPPASDNSNVLNLSSEVFQEQNIKFDLPSKVSTSRRRDLRSGSSARGRSLSNVDLGDLLESREDLNS